MSHGDDSNAEESKSTLYVVTSACLAAIILGFTVFLLIRGFQWRGALAELRTEPGIEILSVERVGFFKKRLRGLRDPLAPSAEAILLKHNIGPHTSDVVLTEYHSLNTPYAEQRSASNAAELKKVRDSLVESVGEFAKSISEKRQADLEKITQMLFEARFPEAMKTVDLQWRDGAWYAEGELYAPEREVFVAESPEYIVEGEIDFTPLVDLTASKTSSLREKIESTNLLETNMDDEFVHVERIQRFVADYDQVCERSNLAHPALQLEIEILPGEQELLDRMREQLLSSATLDSDRFLPDGISTIEEGTSSARLNLVPVSEP
jgi:hypothetical protein